MDKEERKTISGHKVSNPRVWGDPQDAAGADTWGKGGRFFDAKTEVAICGSFIV